MNKKFIKNKKGFMVLEILISAAIVTVTILTATSVAQKSVSLSRQSLHTAQASLLLEEGAEAIRVYRDSGWSNISSMTVGNWYAPAFSGGTWIFQFPSTNTIDIYSRALRVRDVYRDNSTKDIVTSGGTLDPETKLVDVEVSWYEGNQNIKKVLSFYISNIFE